MTWAAAFPMAANLKAVVPGGSSFPILPPDEIDVAMDFDSLRKSRLHAWFRRRGHA